jgi:hypothetical protein
VVVGFGTGIMLFLGKFKICRRRLGFEAAEKLRLTIVLLHDRDDGSNLEREEVNMVDLIVSETNKNKNGLATKNVCVRDARSQRYQLTHNRGLIFYYPSVIRSKFQIPRGGRRQEKRWIQINTRAYVCVLYCTCCESEENLQQDLQNPELECAKTQTRNANLLQNPLLLLHKQKALAKVILNPYPLNI